MKIILQPETIDEVGVKYNDDGIKLCFQTQSGDRVFLVLDDEVLGHVIEHLIYYAWGTTVEEVFKFADEKDNTGVSISINDSASSEIPF
ncbi:hypothetical protein [Desulfitibacter alkalitolerans]|uniref:hypothetical protein n=1 Tax=Desulfitibacter alkalitolerans TaxID=264641 RepID=UPI0004875F13|nr:hypothetical protein [Desulfitibacter alkalitolerans]